MSLASQLRDQVVEVASAVARDVARQEIEMSQQSSQSPAAAVPAAPTVFSKEQVDKVVQDAVAAHQASIDAAWIPPANKSTFVAVAGGVMLGVGGTIAVQKYVLTGNGEEVP